jgi:hypothetical protein
MLHIDYVNTYQGGKPVATRADLMDWVYGALQDLGGKGRVMDVARHIWAKHENDLRASGDLFYSWQYDMRWAALKLRKQGRMEDANKVPRGVWALC